MKRAFASAVFITFVAIGVTWAIMWLFAQRAYGYVPAEALLNSALISMLIAFPTGLMLEAQKRQLQEAKDRLQRSQSMLQEALDDMKRTAELDCLTSLLNRGSFLRRLERLQDAGMEGALLMIDADDFKLINDKFGHAAGDRALTLISDTLTEVVRNNDIVGRIGGEELAVFLLGADRQNAMRVSESIRIAIAGLEFWPTDYRNHTLSVSIGGDMLTRFNTLVEAFANADACLYAAKNGGKNRCVFSNTQADLPAQRAASQKAAA